MGRPLLFKDNQCLGNNYILQQLQIVEKLNDLTPELYPHSIHISFV